ncbi:hypothetical protein NDU88_003259 [Pleurodeles waltl]|uniref:Uncharacterized protein n=1 Tax=Pleurodeles waltl TaxID=8319 RepID=A0AAV7RI02_PLEWA|nr:hypothetical protein NDU88_003259 [Pleurodeles waltl]
MDVDKLNILAHSGYEDCGGVKTPTTKPALQLVPRVEKRRTPTLIDATPSGRPELRRPTSRGEIDATPAVRAKLRTHSPAERHAAGKQAGDSTHRPGTSGNPRDPQKETVCAPENDARLPRVKNNDAKREAKQAEAERAAKQIEAERAEAAAERALAEKKLLLAHELSLKELDLKAKQSESSNNGFSILTEPAGEKKVHIPKNVVPFCGGRRHR